MRERTINCPVSRTTESVSLVWRSRVCGLPQSIDEYALALSVNTSVLIQFSNIHRFDDNPNNFSFNSSLFDAVALGFLGVFDISDNTESDPGGAPKGVTSAYIEALSLISSVNTLPMVISNTKIRVQQLTSAQLHKAMLSAPRLDRQIRVIFLAPASTSPPLQSIVSERARVDPKIIIKHSTDSYFIAPP